MSQNLIAFGTEMCKIKESFTALCTMTEEMNNDACLAYSSLMDALALQFATNMVIE